MIKRTLPYGLLLLTLGLTGCDTRTDLEKQLQAEFDVNRNKGVCFFIPESENLPYTTKYVPREDHGNFFGNQLVNERFDLYTKIGLFEKEKLSENHEKDIYRYNLTELGKQYITPKGFCTGNVYIKEQAKDFDVWDIKSPIPDTTAKKIIFKYQITDYPKWVTENEKRLKASFRTTLLKEGHLEAILIDDGQKQTFEEQDRYISLGYFLYKFNR